ESWLQGKIFFSNQSKPIIIPRWRVQDIDTPSDWQRAEQIALQILSNN
ncbi:MAG: pseudaminic acid cytidylyltransferase, partial [Marinobacter maritimus]